MAEENTTNQDAPGEETLGEDILMIVNGVVTLVLIVVPVLLVRKLIKSIEEGETFKKIERTLSQ
ncbi:MAG: hypothetical protein Q4A07_03720 [Coriobacteriales bacterium]|nr:hypothetical protein [Coriobacteriales bacterium]